MTKFPFTCVHFVGIGGIGMSAVAEMVQALGISVQGSDKQENDNIKRLRGKGMTIFIGQKEENIAGADARVRQGFRQRRIRHALQGPGEPGVLHERRPGVRAA